ncbi:hypothetical protein C8R44DRAFT_875120 [Mycena epipterygia]|nr:hypothetical protein C8R44DRAFT_875120 [Mycena epipterygia]
MPTQISRCARKTAVSVAALSLAVSGAPTIRDGTTAPSTQDFTTGAITTFLQKHQADSAPFVVSNPWTPITFSGSDSAQMTPEAINNLIFNACDQQKNWRTNGTVNFSIRYKDFIQDMNKKCPIGAPTANQTAANAVAADACFGQAIGNELKLALEAYNLRASTPMNNATDPKFLSWAQDSYPGYALAVQNCTAQTLAFDRLTDITQGNDASVYIGAYAHIKPVIDANAPAAGVVMDISNITGTIGTDGDGAEAGDYVAYYSIPTLNTTLSQWQAGTGLAPFHYFSTSQNYSSESTTKFGGASFGFTYEEFGAEAHAGHSDTKTSSEVKASTFGLDFAGLALVGIEQGAWFDHYRVARAAETPDSAHTAVKSVFSNETYFGSQDQPGPLASFNYQALIGFQPSWTIQLVDDIDGSSQSSSEGGGGLSFLGLTIGGYGGKDTAKVNVDNSTNTVTITDQTKNAYILGFVQQTYWG